MPIARARSPGRNEDWISARLPGVSSAPPTPCTARAAASSPVLCASPQSSEAAANQRDPDQEDPAPAVPVAERAAQQDQRGQRQRVGGDRPLQAGQRRVQVPPDRWAAPR